MVLADILWACSVQLGKAVGLISSVFYMVSSVKEGLHGEDLRDFEEIARLRYEQKRPKYDWSYFAQDVSVFINENSVTLEFIQDCVYGGLFVIFIYIMTTKFLQSGSQNDNSDDFDEVSQTDNTSEHQVQSCMPTRRTEPTLTTVRSSILKHRLFSISTEPTSVKARNLSGTLCDSFIQRRAEHLSEGVDDSFSTMHEERSVSESERLYLIPPKRIGEV